MKALFLYSDDKQGKNKSFKYKDKIVKKLSIKYEVTSICCKSLDELKEQCVNCKKNYDVLIVSGGDGTLNRVVNYIAPLKEEERPIIGYIPTGTVNDAGKSYGIKHSVSQALNVILSGYTCKSDIGKINNNYFLYVLAVGQYADISYVTPRRYKKKLGRIAYYFRAIKEAFHYKKIKATVTCDGTKYEVTTPFVLLMNGINVGGFPVNFNNSIKDGLFDIYLTKPGLFNGLLHFAFFKIRTKHIRAKIVDVSTNCDSSWCIDGEEGTKGDVHIECIPTHLTFFCAKKYKD